MHLRSALVALPLMLTVLAGCFGGSEGDDDDIGPAMDAHGFVLPELMCLPSVSAGGADNGTAPRSAVPSADPSAVPSVAGPSHVPSVGGPSVAPSAVGPVTDASAAMDRDAVDPMHEGRAAMTAGMRCNFEMTPDEGREGNEVTIAVNPTDPRNIVGGAKDYYEPDAGECVWDGVYVTHDGGRSAYQDRSFDGSPWRLRAGDVENFEPNYASQFWCTTDPVAYFDVNGNLYYLLMAYQADPATGSDLCQEECPDGALNDWAFNRATQIIAISSDGGDTFHTFTPVLEGSFPANFHDKGWLAASDDGTIHVMWLAFFVPGNQYCRSTDGGQTYLCTEIIAPQFLGAGQGSFLEVGTGPEVYAAWYNGGIQLKRSMDYGETWDEARMVVPTNPQSMPGLSERDRRTGYPALASDRAVDSPFADAIYFTWNDACNAQTWSPQAECSKVGGNAVWVAASHDKGETFSEPVRVSHAGVDDWSIFPAVSVSPGGVVDVSWMETRGTRTVACPDGPGVGDAHCSGEYQTFEQYYAYSLDGGRTFSEPVNIRDAGDQGWDPALCHHQNGMIFIGDYNDIDSSWQAAHPVWPDSRHGVCDVYTATVVRPAFAEGWDPQKMADAQQWIEDHPL